MRRERVSESWWERLHDRWTPAPLSTRFAHRIAAPTTTVLLEGAGHFIVEQPGPDQMRAAVGTFLSSVPR